MRVQILLYTYVFIAHHTHGYITDMKQKNCPCTYARYAHDHIIDKNKKIIVILT